MLDVVDREDVDELSVREGLEGHNPQSGVLQGEKRLSVRSIDVCRNRVGALLLLA